MQCGQRASITALLRLLLGAARPTTQARTTPGPPAKLNAMVNLRPSPSISLKLMVSPRVNPPSMSKSRLRITSMGNHMVSLTCLVSCLRVNSTAAVSPWANPRDMISPRAMVRAIASPRATASPRKMISPRVTVSPRAPWTQAERWSSLRRHPPSRSTSMVNRMVSLTWPAACHQLKATGISTTMKASRLPTAQPLTTGLRRAPPAPLVSLAQS